MVLCFHRTQKDSCSLEGGVDWKDLGELTELERELNNEALEKTGAKATLEIWNT